MYLFTIRDIKLYTHEAIMIIILTKEMTIFVVN